VDLKNNTNEDGYSLVETLIAMALFVSVLLPLYGSVGKLLFDKIPDRKSQALFIAQKEMTEISLNRDFNEIADKQLDGFVVARKIDKKSLDVDVVVIVTLMGSTKPLVVLSRSILMY
jgi:Tfp pilus assembly protein PilV